MWALGNWPTFMTRLCTSTPPHLSPPFWPPCTLLSAPTTPTPKWCLLSSSLEKVTTEQAIRTAPLSLMISVPSSILLLPPHPRPACSLQQVRACCAHPGSGPSPSTWIPGLQEEKDGKGQLGAARYKASKKAEREINKRRELNQRQVQQWQSPICQREFVRPCSASPSCSC